MDVSRFTPFESIAGGASIGGLIVALTMRAADPASRGLVPFAAMSAATAVYFFGFAAYFGAPDAVHAAGALRMQVLGAIACPAVFAWCMAAARGAAPAARVSIPLAACALVLGAADLLSPASLRLEWAVPAADAWTPGRGFAARPAAWTAALHLYAVTAMLACAPDVVALARLRARLAAAGAFAAYATVAAAIVLGTLADYGIVHRRSGFMVPGLVVVLAMIGLVLGARQRRAREELLATGENLRQVNEALRREMEMRTRLERRFAETQKMEALGRMAAGVAHDFNNVLTTISGQAEMLDQRPTLGVPEREALLAIHSASARGSALTQQLLAFTRGRGSDPVRLDPARVIADMAPMLRRLVGSPIELELPDVPGPAEIVADRTKLEQVILNLVVNARDASPEGGRVSVTLGTEPAGEDCTACGLLRTAPRLTIAVTDHGAGMDEAVQARLFEPFFTTKSGDSGTGLGLAIVYSVVEQAGGRITVTSAPGEGTEIGICWPCATDAGQEVVATPREAMPDSAPV